MGEAQRVQQVPAPTAEPFRAWLAAQDDAARRLGPGSEEVQRLRRRRAAYEVVARWPEGAGRPTVSGVAKAVHASRATVNRDFDGECSWAAGPPAANLVAESVEWSFGHYEEGLRAALLRLQPGRDTTVESVLVVTATWALRHLPLATAQPRGPELACRLVVEVDPRLSWAAACQHVEVVVDCCLRDPTMHALGALGTARTRLYPVPARSLDAQQRAAVEEGLLWYVNRLVDAAADGQALPPDADLRPVLDQVSRLLGRFGL